MFTQAQNANTFATSAGSRLHVHQICAVLSPDENVQQIQTVQIVNADILRNLQHERMTHLMKPLSFQMWPSMYEIACFPRVIFFNCCHTRTLCRCRQRLKVNRRKISQWGSRYLLILAQEDQLLQQAGCVLDINNKCAVCSEKEGRNHCLLRPRERPHYFPRETFLLSDWRWSRPPGRFSRSPSCPKELRRVCFCCVWLSHSAPTDKDTSVRLISCVRVRQPSPFLSRFSSPSNIVQLLAFWGQWWHSHITSWSTQLCNFLSER